MFGMVTDTQDENSGDGWHWTIPVPSAHQNTHHSIQQTHHAEMESRGRFEIVASLIMCDEASICTLYHKILSLAGPGSG